MRVVPYVESYSCVLMTSYIMERKDAILMQTTRKFRGSYRLEFFPKTPFAKG